MLLYTNERNTFLFLLKPIIVRAASFETFYLGKGRQMQFPKKTRAMSCTTPLVGFLIGLNVAMMKHFFCV